MVYRRAYYSASCLYGPMHTLQLPAVHACHFADLSDGVTTEVVPDNRSSSLVKNLSPSPSPALLQILSQATSTSCRRAALRPAS